MNAPINIAAAKFPGMPKTKRGMSDEATTAECGRGCAGVAGYKRPRGAADPGPCLDSCRDGESRGAPTSPLAEQRQGRLPDLA